jgi:hypothetical protein
MNTTDTQDFQITPYKKNPLVLSRATQVAKVLNPLFLTIFPGSARPANLSQYSIICWCTVLDKLDFNIFFF